MNLNNGQHNVDLPSYIKSVVEAVEKVKSNLESINCHGFTGMIFGMDGIAIENYANHNLGLSVEPIVGTLFVIHDKFVKTVVHSGIVVGFDENNQPLILSKEGRKSKEGLGGDVTIKTSSEIFEQYSKICKDDLQSWIDVGIISQGTTTETKMYFIAPPK